MVYEGKKYKIESIKKITSNVRLFRVKSKMNPLPGKFIEVSLPGIGECPLASCSYDNKYLDILVRDAGNVTGKLFQLKKNDSIWIRGPYGKSFPIDDFKGKDLILVAGGTGLASITALISYIEKNRKDFGEIMVYFGFRNEESILLRDRINKWNKKFNVNVCLDFSKKNSKCKQGMIHEVMKRDKLSPKNLKNISVAMCGPEPMMEAITKFLGKLGVKDNQIYWSMERRMECAFGSCGRCLIQDVYTCKDGPIFRYDFIKPKLRNEKESNKG